MYSLRFAYLVISGLIYIGVFSGVRLGVRGCANWATSGLVCICDTWGGSSVCCGRRYWGGRGVMGIYSLIGITGIYSLVFGVVLFSLVRVSKCA